MFWEQHAFYRLFQQLRPCFSNCLTVPETRVSATVCFFLFFTEFVKTEYGVFSYSRTVVLKKFVIFTVIFMVNKNRAFLHVFFVQISLILCVELRNFSSSVSFEIFINFHHGIRAGLGTQ